MIWGVKARAPIFPSTFRKAIAAIPSGLRCVRVLFAHTTYSILLGREAVTLLHSCVFALVAVSGVLVSSFARYCRLGGEKTSACIRQSSILLGHSPLAPLSRQPPLISLAALLLHFWTLPLSAATPCFTICFFLRSVYYSSRCSAPRTINAHSAPPAPDLTRHKLENPCPTWLCNIIIQTCVRAVLLFFPSLHFFSTCHTFQFFNSYLYIHSTNSHTKWHSINTGSTF